MFIDKNDSSRLRAISVYERDEGKFIKSFVKPHMICVDIGAHIGYHTLTMAKIAKHIYAFEPCTQSYNILLKNIRLNGRTKKVTVYPYAVGETTGEVTLYKCAENSGSNRIYQSKRYNAGKETVHMVALDSMITHADFIKMDIEGSEYGALLGMNLLLKESKPVLLMEFHPPSIKEYGINPIQIYNYMLSLDYNIEFPDKPTILLSYNELENLRPGINILCIPREKK